AFDIANAIAQMDTKRPQNPLEQPNKGQPTDANSQQNAINDLDDFTKKQALLAETLRNIADMRHEMMKTVANNLKAGGANLFGLQLDDMSDDLRRRYKINNTVKGVVIVGVEATKSPNTGKKFLPGEVIVEFEHEAVANSEALQTKF